MFNKKKNESKEEKPVSKKKKIINIIEYIIIGIVIIVNATLIIKSAINPKKAPDLFGKKAFVIISGSMIPTIQIGDIVVLNDDVNAAIDNIIGFRNKTSTVIVHRVINEKENEGDVQYQTKGDNNNVADIDWVKKDDIEGIYIFKIPFIGKILMFLYNHLALVVVVLLVVLLIKFFI